MTEHQRFDSAFAADNIGEGDDIDRRLVARHPDQLGAPLRPPANPTDDPEPDTQLVAVTAIRSMDDTHTALLYHPESETFFRAGKHARQSAMTQREADWTVRDIGHTADVTAVHDLDRPEGEQDQDPAEYVAEWVEILLDDIRYHDGDRDTSDEMELDGTTLKLRDGDGRSALATIDLTD